MSVNTTSHSYTSGAGGGKVFLSPAALGAKITTLNVVNGNLTGAVDLSRLTALQTLTAQGNALSGFLDLSKNTALTSCSAYVNAFSGSLDLSKNTALTYIHVSNNGFTGSLDLSANTSLTSGTFHTCSFSGTIDISANTVLTTLYLFNNQFSGFAGTVSANVSLFRAENNLLTQAAVDAILVAFNNAGRTSGTLNVGGTGNAAPSATGLAAKTALTSGGKTWTVTTN